MTDQPQTTESTEWIGARVFGRYCAQEGMPREAPTDLPADALAAFFDGYDREVARAKDELNTTLSWQQKIALIPLVVVAYFVPLSFLAIVGIGSYHYVGWLCCGVPL